MKSAIYILFISISIFNHSTYAQGVITEGARIKTEKRVGIYINLDNELRQIKNYSMVLNTFNIPANYTVVSEAEFQKYPIGAPINEFYLAKAKDAAIFLIINDQKRHIVNPKVFEILDFNWSAVKILTEEELWKIETGKPLKLINSAEKNEELLPCGVH